MSLFQVIWTAKEERPKDRDTFPNKWPIHVITETYSWLRAFNLLLFPNLVIITKCMDCWLLKKASSIDDRGESKQERQNSEEIEVRQEKENLKKKNIYIYIYIPGLPWWHRGEESACQCRRHRFSLWSRKIPQASEWLSPCATTTAPVCLEPILWNKRSQCNVNPQHRNWRVAPGTTTREKPEQQWRSSTAKNK